MGNHKMYSHFSYIRIRILVTISKYFFYKQIIGNQLLFFAEKVLNYGPNTHKIFLYEAEPLSFVIIFLNAVRV